jgi:hypothetical protein
MFSPDVFSDVFWGAAAIFLLFPAAATHISGALNCSAISPPASAGFATNPRDPMNPQSGSQSSEGDSWRSAPDVTASLDWIRVRECMIPPGLPRR